MNNEFTKGDIAIMIGVVIVFFLGVWKIGEIIAFVFFPTETVTMENHPSRFWQELATSSPSNESTTTIGSVYVGSPASISPFYHDNPEEDFYSMKACEVKQDRFERMYYDSDYGWIQNVCVNDKDKVEYTYYQGNLTKFLK